MATASVFTVDRTVVEKALSAVHTDPQVCRRRAGRLMGVMALNGSPFTWQCKACRKKFQGKWCEHRSQGIAQVAFSPKNIFAHAQKFTAYSTRPRNAGPEVLMDFELLNIYLIKTTG